MSSSANTEQRVDIRQKASMTHWWPRLQTVDVPTPETIEIGLMDVETDDGAPATDGTTTVQLVDTDELVAAVAAVGGPPAFLRSDQMSAKHDMEDGSKISDFDTVRMNAWTLWEHLAMAWGVPDAEAYYVREWLDLASRFKAFGGTPIAPELRFFIHGGELWDSGFYWPADAICRPNREDWQERHTELKRTAFEDTRNDAARFYAKRVAEEFDEGYWSVDFALTEDDQWYCIDMSPGELSWHPDSVTPPEEVDR